jgi:hypothetical protein
MVHGLAGARALGVRVVGVRECQVAQQLERATRVPRSGRAYGCGPQGRRTTGRRPSNAHS